MIPHASLVTVETVETVEGEDEVMEGDGVAEGEEEGATQDLKDDGDANDDVMPSRESLPGEDEDGDDDVMPSKATVMPSKPKAIEDDGDGDADVMTSKPTAVKKMRTTEAVEEAAVEDIKQMR